MLRVIRTSPLPRYCLALLGSMAALLFLVPGLRENFFATGVRGRSFITREQSYLEVGPLVAAHFWSDLAIGVSCVAISLTLAYLVRRARRDIPCRWFFVAFGLFLVACGLIHFAEMATTYGEPRYWMAGYLKLVTAAASVAAALALLLLVPRALALVREARLAGQRRLELEAAGRELEALRRSNRTLEAIIQASPLAIVTLDEGARVRSWNSAAERIFGWTEEEVLGRPLPTVPEELREEVRRNHRAAVAGRPFSNYETRRRRKDGASIDVSISTAPLSDEEGGRRGVVALVEDITERRRAEAALRESEERFRTLVEQSPFSTQVFSPDGWTVQVNPAWERLWGVKLSDIPGYNVLADEQLVEKGIAPYIRRGFAGEATPIPPIAYEPPSGRFEHEPRWVSAYIYPVKDDGGRVREVVLVHEDISEQRRAEQAVLESRRLLQVVTDSAPLYITYCDAERRFQFVNEAYARRFGVDPSAVIGKRIPEVVGEVAYASFSEHVDAALAGRRVAFEMEIPYEQLGSQFVHADYVPHRDEAGEVRGFVGVITDVSERKRAEREQKFLSDATTALASSLDYEATLEAVAHLAAAHVADYCLVDLLEDDGRIRRLTVAHHDAAREAAWREMQRRFPVSPDSDHTVVRVLRTGRAELFSDMDGGTLEGAIPDARHREELRRLGVRSAMTVPLVARGRIVGAVTFISAESGRRYGERELRLAEELAGRAGLAVDNARLYQRAQEANRAKDEFLATLSHELRTPLTPIVGWVHLMRSGQIARDDLEHGLGVVDKNSQALSRLIGDLLDMSAILNHKMRLDRETVALDSIIRQAAETVRPQAEQRGVRIEVASCGVEGGGGKGGGGGDGGRGGEGAGPLAVAGDRMRLAQVFWNLLSNAVKFSHGGGHVRVLCERDGEWARVHVEDEGIGIEPEFLPRVFDRFQQADMSTTKQYGGLGIGLALVRSLVEAHGGAVTAASAGRGRGSRFTVRLPLHGLRNVDFGFRNDEQPPAVGRRPSAIDDQQPTTGGQPLTIDGRPSSTDETPKSPVGGQQATAGTEAGAERPTAGVGQSPSDGQQSRVSAIRNQRSAIGSVRGAQPAIASVLLVEDATDTLEMLRVFLVALGYEVAACRAAADALAVAAGRQFDIIVSDIGLPNTDGYELLRRLREETPHLAAVPAVALTGYAAPRDVELAHEAGFAAHVAKPFEPAQLAELIGRLLAGRGSGGGTAAG